VILAAPRHIVLAASARARVRLRAIRNGERNLLALGNGAYHGSTSDRGRDLIQRTFFLGRYQAFNAPTGPCRLLILLGGRPSSTLRREQVSESAYTPTLRSDCTGDFVQRGHSPLTTERSHHGLLLLLSSFHLQRLSIRSPL